MLVKLAPGENPGQNVRADGIGTSWYVANKLWAELYIGPDNVNKSYFNEILF